MTAGWSVSKTSHRQNMSDSFGEKTGTNRINGPVRACRRSEPYRPDYLNIRRNCLPSEPAASAAVEACI